MLIIVPGRESIAAAKRTGSAEEDADRENILTMAVWYYPCRLQFDGDCCPLIKYQNRDASYRLRSTGNT